MHVYYAVAEQEDGSAFGLWFPDLPSVFSAADEEKDIVVHGIEALHLWSEDETLPEPSPIRAILDQTSVRQALARGAFLVRIPLIEDAAHH